MSLCRRCKGRGWLLAGDGIKECGACFGTGEAA